MQAQLLKGLISTIRMLAPVPEEEWLRMATKVSERRLAKGETFAVPGQNSHELAFVGNGLLRLFYLRRDGREYTKEFRAAGTFVGAYSSLLTQSTNELTIEALDETTLLTLNYDVLRELYDRHVCWQILGRKIAEGLYLEREQREFELLVLDAKERLARFRQRSPDIVPRLKQHVLASYLGITPVSLSRLTSGE